MAYIAKIFQHGDAQAVLLPQDIRFTVDEVEAIRHGDAVILRPKSGSSRRWALLHAAVDRGFSPDFNAEGQEQLAPPPCPELVQALQ